MLLVEFALRLIYSCYFRSALHGFFQFHFYFQLRKEHFPPTIFNFDLWLWPTSFNWTRSKWTTKPNVSVKIHFVRKFLYSHTDTHTQLIGIRAGSVIKYRYRYREWDKRYRAL